MNAPLLLTALFNGAWQGAVLCTLALFAFRLFRRLNATTMFAVWSVLLAIAVLLPFANYAFAPKPYVVRVSATAQAALSNAEGLPRGGARAASVTLRYRSAPSVTPRYRSAQTSTLLAALATAILRYARLILALLALVAIVRLALLARDVVRMLIARRRVRPIESPVPIDGNLARPFRYAASNEFTSPCVLGFAPALIIIPEDLLADDTAELTSVVLHEREHVRRYDDVQNVVHRFIGAICFFCPGVRIGLRELALYREQICDDAAVNATGDRISYAMTLTDLAQWAQGHGAPVPSLIFKRKHLLHRLEVLLDSAVSHSLRMNRRFALAAAGALVLAAALVLRIQVPVIAETLAPPAPGVRITRAQMEHMRTTVKQIRVQATQTRTQLKAVRAQMSQMHVQVVKMHADARKARVQAKQLRTEFVHAHEHLHEHAAASTVATSTTSSIATMVSTTSKPSGDLLDALNTAGLHNLSVDDLIALRDHGVSSALVSSAVSYFGHVSAQDLVYLADHGVGPSYIGTLTSSGVRGISPKDATTLMDHGVSAQLIAAASAYFGRASAGDLTRLADHGVSSAALQGLRSVGLTGVSVDDVIRLYDNGIEARYVAKVRRFNPNATIDEIIRLRNAGF